MRRGASSRAREREREVLGGRVEAREHVLEQLVGQREQRRRAGRGLSVRRASIGALAAQIPEKSEEIV